MNKKLFFAVMLLSALLPLAVQASVFTKAPKVEQRINPNYSKTQVFSFYDSIKEAKEGVVNISTKKVVRTQQSPFMQDPFFRDFFGHRFGTIPRERMERSLGSGVIINEKGYIVTNNHVIKDASEIIVTLPRSKKEYKAKLIGSDPRSDLAVVKIEAKNLQPIKLANSNNLRVGDIVFAIGNPFGIGETVTQGIVSALGRNGVGINEYENFIQTDASINPGNSGGALIDSRGYLIGINTAIISRGGGNNGVGFAIPSAMVEHVVNSLVEHGSVKRGLLGVGIENISEDLFDFYERRDGAVVNHVVPDSAAEKAGIRRGDLIIAVDETEVLGASELKNIIGSIAPGTTVKLTIIRDKKRITVKAKLEGKKESQEKLEELGMQLQDITPRIRQEYRIPSNVQGAFIQSVTMGSAASESGLESGDVIIQVESQIIDSVDTFKKSWNYYKGLKKKRVYIYRNGYTHLAVVK